MLSVWTIVSAATAWAVISLLFFLLFSLITPRPEWYRVMTYVLENVAFLGAGILCFRNWRSPQIVSGGTVWLAIGLGMFSYFIGNLFLAYWELGLHNSPDVSPGDLFYILTYLFLGWGMGQAVLSRQLNLTLVQWIILLVIAAVAIIIAILLHQPSAETALKFELTPPAIAQTAPASPTAAPTAPAVGVSAPPVASPVGANEVSETAADAASATPAWATALEKQLSPMSDVVGVLYIIGDVILLVMATALLLAYWGGRFSLSWRFIAAAAFSYYIGDIWFSYATDHIPNYETGALLEVFWIFSGCLFAIGAALEYDLSTRRQTRRRRT
jgi:hypothetical protein